MNENIRGKHKNNHRLRITEIPRTTKQKTLTKVLFIIDLNEIKHESARIKKKMPNQTYTKINVSVNEY